MKTLKQALILINSIERTEENKVAYDKAMDLIANVENDTKSVSTLKNLEEYIEDCKKLDKSALEISELKRYDKDDKSHEIAEEVKKAMTAAERKAKSRAEAKKKGGDVLGGVTLTSKAADQLSALCFEWDMNKTEVINKLLEEQEQRQLL